MFAFVLCVLYLGFAGVVCLDCAVVLGVGFGFIACWVFLFLRLLFLLCRVWGFCFGLRFVFGCFRCWCAFLGWLIVMVCFEL